MLSRWFTAYVGENILITRDCAVHGKTGLGFNRCHLAFGLRRQGWRSQAKRCTCRPVKRGLLFDSHSVNDSTAWVMCSCVKACVPVWSLPFLHCPITYFSSSHFHICKYRTVFPAAQKHHNALSATLEQPDLPQGSEAKRNNCLIHGFTSKFYSQQGCGL